MKKLLGMAGKKQMILPQIPEILIYLTKLTIVITTCNMFFFSFPSFPYSSSCLHIDDLSLLPFLLCMFSPWSSLHLVP